MELIGRTPRPPFTAALLLLAAAVFGVTRTAGAQPVPALTNVAPVYLKQGDAQELTLTGQDLANVLAVVVPDPRGLDAVLVKPEKPTDPIRVKLAAAADAPLGVRELRLVTPLGVTRPLTVAVGQYPSSPDKEPNNAPDTAQPVELPANLGGRIESPGDADVYRFEAKKGQHLVFDVHAARVGSALDPVLTIHDAAGRELPHADAHHGGDPMAVFDVPADGAYLLQVRDLQYRGGGDYAYQIEAGPIPYLESLVPMSGRRGQKVEVAAIGHNLQGGGRITLDLTDADPGPMPVRARTPLGLSNEVPFIVTDVSQAAEKEPNDIADTATPVALPADITGTLQQQGDEDFYRFQVPARRQVTAEVQARKTGSPVDALLTLRDAKGDVIEQTNGTADAEARVSRALEPGGYVVSVRDLTYGGGPGYAYRLNVSPAGGLPPDFAVRFLPDAPRVARGGSVKLWCEVVRMNGYKGDVAVTLEGLPAGVTAGPGPIVLGEKTSGVFTLTATPDAALGTAPIKLKAAGTVGGQEVTREAGPELNNRLVQQAYLTVLEPAPFTVDAVALITPAQIDQYGKQAADLYNRLNTQTPQLDAAQAEWEKKATAPAEWVALDPEKLTSAAGVPLAKQPDGSVLAGGSAPDKDTYTAVATTDLKGITAVRLEVLPDPSLPQNGPGRAPNNGNFVLSRFAVAAAPKADPGKAKPLTLANPRATFAQDNYPPAAALDDKGETGWAIDPQTGRPQSAYFFTPSPAGFDGGTVLTFTLDQQFGRLHTLGRFRLSVTTDPEAAKKEKQPAPGSVVAIIKTPADKRTPDQKAQLSAYYRSIVPELAADRARLEALRNSVGPYAEIARLEAMLNTGTTALDAERKEWEQAALTGGWSVPDVVETRSANGTLLSRESDGSLSASGNSPPTDTYTVVVSTPLKQVSAVRVEALPDERFPGNGPGRAPGGNFILTRLQVMAAARGGAPAGPADKKDKPAPAMAVDLRAAKADFEQQGWPAVGALDDRHDTGWGVAPNTGRPASAVFSPRSPVAGGEGGTVLTLSLEQQSNQPQHTLGRFRVWVTGSPDPDAAATLPDEIAATLKTPADKRTDPQKTQLAAYHRSISPSLDSVRGRLAELKARVAPLPLTVARNRAGVIPVPVLRTGAFAGDVQVTLEGFTAGRDAATRMPGLVTKNLTVTPLTLKGDDAFGKLSFRANGTSDVGTRMVVIRAEAKVGNDTYVQYSPAFPLTVTEK